MRLIPGISILLLTTACLLVSACDRGASGTAGGGANLQRGDGGEQCTNPETGEPDTRVECLVDPCSVATCEGDSDATCAASYCGGCHATFTAADGTPARCEVVACPADAMICPDGSYVSRDPANDCAFKACPRPVACTQDAKVCPDGTTLGRDPDNDCKFPACPDQTVCMTDAKECPDGSFVGRDPANDCEFELCEGECRNPATGEPDTLVSCFADPCSVNTCDAFPEASCTANYCGGCHAVFTNEAGEVVDCELVTCTADAKQCPDGSWVGRDGSNNCEWLPCP